MMCLLTTSPLRANSPPPEVINEIPKAELLGKSELRVGLLLKIYDIELWVEDRSRIRNSWQYDQRFCLSITYNRNISKESLVYTTIEEMKTHASLSNEETIYRERLTNIYKDVKYGDRISAIFIPNKKLTLYLNNTILGQITNMTFAKQFLDIWLHPRAKYKIMQDSLMGKV